MANKKPRLLLPLPSKQASDPPQELDRPKRVPTPSACKACRARKQKCGGERPICARCAARSTECLYDAEEGETSSLALKRKHAALEQEVQDLRELLGFIHDRSQREAYEIVERLRLSNDPVGVLRFVKAADLLLQPSNIRSSDDTTHLDSRIQKLDADALAQSSIKVSARPWTTIVGDGILSELISGFLATENIFLLPVIDVEAFLDDLKAANIRHAKFCSPLLVNAICALRSDSSTRTQIIGALTGQNMTEKFMSECRKLLDSEGGRASIPTVQALCAMYLTLTVQGRDRAATIFRYMAVEMTKRLKLENRYAISLKKNDSKQCSVEQRVVSKAAWGVFCFETRVSYQYGQRALLRPPSIPNLFDELSNGSPGSSVCLGDSMSYGSSLSAEIAEIPGIVQAICDLSVIFYDVMTAKTGDASVSELDGQSDDAKDATGRGIILRRLQEWMENLPPHFKADVNFTFQSCFLQAYVNEIVYVLLLDQDPAWTPPGQCMSAKNIIIHHCELDTDLFERHMKSNPPVTLLGRGLYVSTAALIPFLDDPRTHVLFTKNSFMLRLCIPHLRITALLLKGIRAMVWAMKKRMPASAKAYFEGLDDMSGPQIDPKDVPTAFALPHQQEILELLSDDGSEQMEKLGDQLATLIARWSSLTIT